MAASCPEPTSRCCAAAKVKGAVEAEEDDEEDDDDDADEDAWLEDAVDAEEEAEVLEEPHPGHGIASFNRKREGNQNN